jgi:RNA polymerase sigma-70 factor, ECF subfamily
LDTDRASPVPRAGNIVRTQASASTAAATSTATRERAELRIQSLVAGGDVGSAVTGVLRLYGPEVFGFVSALIEVPAFAREVYAKVGERLSLGLRTFTWRCDLRTWMYAMARGELLAFREKYGSPVNVHSPAQKPPSSSPFRQTALRGTISAVRRRLSPEDRELLILRVDRRLSWRSLAFSSLGEMASEAELTAEEGRLREALKRLKWKLAQMAREHGILAAR